MLRNKRPLERLVRAAMGEIKADLLITGGRLINVYSGEIIDGWEIAAIDGRICYVGPSARHTRGAATQVLDAGGLYVSPGFIDAHTHIGHYCRPYEQLQSFVPRGTTTLMASCDELASVFGFKGLQLFLDEVERHPLRVYTLVSMVAPQDPLLCRTATFTDAEIAEALADPRVLGMGEIVSWLRLIQCDTELLRRIELGRESGQIIHGHTAGARDQKLCAVAATGVSSCHEPIRFEDALERLRLGYWTMLREGSLRQDLEPTLKLLVDEKMNLQRLILVTDSMAPDDVEKFGHMDHVLRRAVSLGMAPVAAIQSVTLNPATYSGLEQEIGGIAPGRWADIALVEDLQDFCVRQTFIGGKLVAEDGTSVVENQPIAVPEAMMNSLGIRGAVSGDDFRVSCAATSAKIRVMRLVNQTITAEEIREVATGGGAVTPRTMDDLLKVAVFDRHGGSLPPVIGFLAGFGFKGGAVGITTNIDENAPLIVGSNDDEMALCVNALSEMGGGMVITNRGQIIEKLAFPFAGIFSLDNWKSVGRGLELVQRCLRDFGARFEKPIYALAFLTFVTLPALRITARGLVDAKQRRIVPLFVE
jgi:adenine deaminase